MVAMFAAVEHPPEWYERRVGLVTSSVAPAIFGACKYNSPYQAKLLIKGELRKPATPATYRGSKLERPVLEVGSEWAGLQLGLPGPCLLDDAAFKAHENGWTGDSTDALYVHPDTGEVAFLAEGKTVAGDEVDDWGIPGTDQVPDRVLIQCCWHLYHWPEVQSCVVPVLLASRWAMTFEVYEVQRNSELIGSLIQDAEKWYHDHIVQDLDPPVDRRDLEALRSRYPRSMREAMDMTAELEALALDKLKWAAAAKAEDDAKSAIIKIMGDYGSARSERVSITFRNQADSRKVAWEKLARHLGATDAQIEQFTETIKGPRKLTVKALKQKKEAAHATESEAP